MGKVKFADRIIEEINIREKSVIKEETNNSVNGEEFERWLRRKNINLSIKEITEDCKNILSVLNNEED